MPDEHARKWIEISDRGPVWTARICCGCGWTYEWDTRRPRPPGAWHAEHLRQVAAVEAQRQRDWYEAHGHCGLCGQPGNYCVCRETNPCACRDLHPMGSGLTDDALEAFAEPGVSADQEGLFDA